MDGLSFPHWRSNDGRQCLKGKHNGKNMHNGYVYPFGYASQSTINIIEGDDGTPLFKDSTYAMGGQKYEQQVQTAVYRFRRGVQPV